MLIPRYYKIQDYITPKKVLILYGPRQAGKTTMLEHYLESCGLKYRFDTGDNILTHEILGTPNLQALQEYVSGYQLLAIDEAQKIPNIGETLKLMIDKIPECQIIATGSSSFELAGQVGEPLTGRKKVLTLYPVAQLEMAEELNRYDLKAKLENDLIYGSYPEVAGENTLTGKRELVMEIVQSYLLKDILELDKIKNAKILLDLLRLLAFQIGKQVSHSELGKQLGIDTKTIGRYLDLLEKSFVIYNLRGYSQNLRKEITKKSIYYFYDVGIRNGIISNFNPIKFRNDVGELWENFVIIERLKKQAYHNIYANNYFWRTWDQQEIDFVEEREGNLFGYEIKWGKKLSKPPKDWVEHYPDAKFQIINKETYLDFIL